MKRNLIVTIFGRKGSGKTWLSYSILREFRRVVAIDTVAQYGPEQGFEVVHGKAAGARALAAASKKPEFKIALRSDDTEELLALLGVVYTMHDILLIVDEAPFYCSPQKLPREMSAIVRMGRHREISQLYIGQRPSEVHRSITAQSDIVVSFVQREERDVKYLVENGGGYDAEHVAQLPKYKLIAFGDGMERDDVPVAIIAQRHTFGGGVQEELDLGER